MQMIIDDGETIAGNDIIEMPIVIPQDGEYHLTYPRDMLLMNFRFLPTMEFHYEPDDVFVVSPVAGSVNSIGSLTTIGPQVFIGEGSEIGVECHITESYLFPNSHIGDRCNLRQCIVYDGIIIPDDTFAEAKIFLPEEVAKLL